MEEMLALLKTLLGPGCPAGDALLKQLLQTTADKTLAFTRQPAVPRALQGVVAEMAADSYYLLLSAQGAGTGEVTGSVASITDHGQSVSYREGDGYGGILSTVAETTLKNYQGQLERWRKAGW